MAILALSQPVRPAAADEAGCLVIAAWDEARGEPNAVIEAVVSTILNRARARGLSVCDAVMDPAAITGVTPAMHELFAEAAQPHDAAITAQPHTAHDQSQLAVVRAAAAGALAGTLPDRSNGATHFYSPAGMRDLGLDSAPKWASSMLHTATVGPFVFLREKGGAPLPHAKGRHAAPVIVADAVPDSAAPAADPGATILAPPPRIEADLGAATAAVVSPTEPVPWERSPPTVRTPSIRAKPPEEEPVRATIAHLDPIPDVAPIPLAAAMIAIEDMEAKLEPAPSDPAPAAAHPDALADDDDPKAAINATDQIAAADEVAPDPDPLVIVPDRPAQAAAQPEPDDPARVWPRSDLPPAPPPPRPAASWSRDPAWPSQPSGGAIRQVAYPRQQPPFGFWSPEPGIVVACRGPNRDATMIAINGVAVRRGPVVGMRCG